MDGGALVDSGGGSFDSSFDAGRDAGRDAGGSLDAGRDAGTMPDAGTCATGGLLSSFVSVTVTGSSPGSQIFGAPTSDGGAVAAWRTASNIILQRLSGAGARVGSEISITGTGLYGLAATPDTFAALVSRGTDALYLVGTSDTGASRFSRRVLGEVDHSVTNNEWFGTSIRYGRLTWTGSELVAYYTVNRLWPDGIAHYGDQLRSYGADGVERTLIWGWGCSHSMETRIVHNGTRLGPVCASDCYPSKGIHFNHRGGRLYTDDSGSDCRGRYATTLGGVVPMADGFWVTFTATDARSSHDVALRHVGNDQTLGTLRWLTSDGTHDRYVKAARYGSGFVVAWVGGDGQERFQHFDANGVSLEGPVVIPNAGLAGASDFFVFSDGDVGWVTGSASVLRLGRLRACRP